MPHDHKTKAGLIIHTIGLFFHKLFNQPITPELIKNYAEDIAAVANVYNDVAAETAGITDPAAKVKAICQGLLNNVHKLPLDLKTSDLEQYIIDLCHKITSLPLEEIESLVKAELSSKH